MRICPNCRNDYEGDERTRCPHCGYRPPSSGLEFDEEEAEERELSLEPEPLPSEAAPESARPAAEAEAGAGEIVRCYDCGAVFMGRPGAACPKCGQARTAGYDAAPPPPAPPARETLSRMSCADCGQIFDGAAGNFCPHCGSSRTGPAAGVAPAPAEAVGGLITCAGCGAPYDPRVGAACPRCGAPAPAGQGPAPPDAGPVLRCPSCGAVFAGRPGDPCPRCGAAAGQPSGLPWQDRREKGLNVVQAIWQTILAVHRNPRESFGELRFERGLGEPIVYQLWLIGAVVLCGLPLQLLSAGLGAFPFFGGGFGGGQGVWKVPVAAGIYLGMGILGIGLTIAWDLFAAWVLNRILVGLGGERTYVTETYCVLAYGMSSTRPWGLVPGCGGLIGLIWSIVIGCSGLSAVHRVSAGKAFLALVLLLMIFVMIVIGVGAAVFGLMALAGAI
jgi:rRNA maturation endonuclease Nob1